MRHLAERVVLPRDGSLDYLRTLVRRLEQNRVVSVFGNIQGARAAKGIEILGTHRKLATGAPALARRTDAALLTMRARRLGPLEYEVVIDEAIDDISSFRGDIGAVQNRIQVTISNLSSARENLSAANSRIRDVDVASETADLTKNSIMQQAAVSVLQQANTQPQVALSLLQG